MIRNLEDFEIEKEMKSFYSENYESNDSDAGERLKIDLSNDIDDIIVIPDDDDDVEDDNTDGTRTVADSSDDDDVEEEAETKSNIDVVDVEKSKSSSDTSPATSPSADDTANQQLATPQRVDETGNRPVLTYRETQSVVLQKFFDVVDDGSGTRQFYPHSSRVEQFYEPNVYSRLVVDYVCGFTEWVTAEDGRSTSEFWSKLKPSVFILVF